MTSVVLPWHVDEDRTDEKLLIGVYATEPDGEAAIDGLKDKPGFIDTRSRFMMERHEINADHWTEGFVVVDD